MFCCLTSYDKNDPKLVVVDPLKAPVHKRTGVVEPFKGLCSLVGVWISVTFISRGDHRPPPTFHRSALIEHQFCSKDSETLWKFEV